MYFVFLHHDCSVTQGYKAQTSLTLRLTHLVFLQHDLDVSQGLDGAVGISIQRLLHLVHPHLQFMQRLSGWHQLHLRLVQTLLCRVDGVLELVPLLLNGFEPSVQSSGVVVAVGHQLLPHGQHLGLQRQLVLDLLAELLAKVSGNGRVSLLACAWLV